ncbi:MAG TPA: CPBP family intramembrane glutamic endopeptidase [Pyrinomonadaceae bacterium]|jgi:hypothetical protein
MDNNRYLATIHPFNWIFLFCAIVYLALIFGLWTVYVSTVYPSVISIGNLPARIFLNEFIRICIFVAPVFLLLTFVIGEKPISFLKLDKNIRSGILCGVVASIGYTMLVLARIILANGGSNPKLVPLEAWFTALTVATLIEEIAFRGFLLQAFERFMNFWIANLLTATLFVAIHFPGWIIIGKAPLLPDKMVAMAEILFLGLLLGFLFKRAQSLWACVILHSTNNLLSTILFG